MRNIRLTTVAIVIIASTTSSVFASWWNPTTWKIFRRDNKISVEQKIDNTTTSSQGLQNANENNTLSCNGSKYSQCPSGQIFICPTTGDAFCEKSVKDEIKTPILKDSSVIKVSESIVSKKTESPIKKESVSAENFNITILTVTDSLIKTYTDYSTFFKKFEPVLTEREQETTTSKQKIDSFLREKGSMMDPGDYNVYTMLSKIYSDELLYIKSLKTVNQQNISNIENFTLLLKQYRTQKENSFYSNSAATQEAKSLMPFYDKLDPYMASFSSLRSAYFDYIKKNDDLVYDVLTRMQQSITVDINNLEAQRKSVNNYAPSVQIIMIPKIEMPKMPTSISCDTRYTGIHGNYTTNCTER